MLAPTTEAEAEAQAQAGRASHMETDGDESSSIASLLLYCDEDPLVSTTPPPPSAATSSSVVVVQPQQQQESLVLIATAVGDVEEEDHLKELLVDHLARQRFYAPTCRGDYLQHLLLQQQQQQGPEAAIISGTGSVSGARSRGVHYIIYAFGRLGLTVATVFNAVNYLDRFLSINCHLCWEAWMVELVSVACLSIACKLDEVNIPSLHDLQMEEVMSHSFLPASVQDMELTLLKALQWRLACVTSYSFLQILLPLITPRTTASAASRCTHLLIHSLTEPSFIQFDSSVIASSALVCVLAAMEDQHHRRHHQTYGYNISRLIRPHCPASAMENKDADECFRMMETHYASCCSESDSDWNWNTAYHHQLYSCDERLWSPVSVIRPETAGGGGRLINSSRSAVSRRRLFGSSSSAPQGIITTQDDDEMKISHTHK